MKQAKCIILNQAGAFLIDEDGKSHERTSVQVQDQTLSTQLDVAMLMKLRLDQVPLIISPQSNAVPQDVEPEQPLREAQQHITAKMNTVLKASAVANQPNIPAASQLSASEVVAVSAGSSIGIVSYKQAKDRHLCIELATPVMAEDGKTTLSTVLGFEPHFDVPGLDSAEPPPGGGNERQIKLAVPYDTQIDNDTAWHGPGSRQCNTSSCFMLASYLLGGRFRSPSDHSPGTLEEKATQKGYEYADDYYGYLVAHSGSGNTTDHNAQTQALKQLGIDSYFSYTVSFEQILESLRNDCPVVVGVGYRSSGHILVVVGVDLDKKFFWMNDPYGVRAGAGEYEQIGPYGAFDRYSFSLLDRILFDVGVGREDCWARVVTSVNGQPTGNGSGVVSMEINLADAAKAYRQLPHQDTAWDNLEAVQPMQILKELGLENTHLKVKASQYQESSADRTLWDRLQHLQPTAILQEFSDAYGDVSMDVSPSMPPDAAVQGTEMIALAAALIKEFEGCHDRRSDGRIYVYPDPKSGGVPYTVGWGSTLKRNGAPFVMGESFTQQYCDELFEEQLASDYLPPIRNIPHWDQMSAHEQAALVSFGYNLGAHAYGNLVDFPSYSRAIDSGDWDEIRSAMKRYHNPRDTNVRFGLYERRCTEANFSKGMPLGEARRLAHEETLQKYG